MGLCLTNQPLFTCDFLLVSSPLDRWEDVEPLTDGVYDGLGKWLFSSSVGEYCILGICWFSCFMMNGSWKGILFTVSFFCILECPRGTMISWNVTGGFCRQVGWWDHPSTLSYLHYVTTIWVCMKHLHQIVKHHDKQPTIDIIQVPE